jgi:hypothetical protein
VTIISLVLGLVACLSSMIMLVGILHVNKANPGAFGVRGDAALRGTNVTAAASEARHPLARFLCRATPRCW